MPLAITGPVGWPVGEPPTGSIDTASVESALTCGRSSGGTTTFTDMYYFEETIAGAVDEAGLRAVLGQTIIGFPLPTSRPPTRLSGQRKRSS